MSWKQEVSRHSCKSVPEEPSRAQRVLQDQESSLDAHNLKTAALRQTCAQSYSSPDHKHKLEATASEKHPDTASGHLGKKGTATNIANMETLTLIRYRKFKDLAH